MAAPSEASAAPDYGKDFIRILKNESKYESRPSFVPRKRGFVVVVRGGSNLKPLQNLCFEEDVKSRNRCLTARYRLQPDAGIGTLLVAFLSDLYKMRSHEQPLGVGDSPAGEGARRVWEFLLMGPVAGDLDPAHFSEALRFSEAWRSMTDVYLERVLNAELDLSHRLREPNVQGILQKEQLSSLLEKFDDESSVLRAGDRLVLFGELSEEATNPDEWKASLETLLELLPERVGMVFSGVPKDLNLELSKDDPHFLEITLPEGTDTDGPTQFLYKFTDSSFHRDEPASKDELDVNAYANALARFILHKQTLPPLTIGIHGRWGKGKSSFMKLVDSALVKYAAVNNVGRWELLLLGRWKLNRKARTEGWNVLVRELSQAEPAIQALLADKRTPGKEERKERQRQLDKYDKQKRQEARLWKTMTKKAEQNIIGVRFNAWQFEDAKQTWAGLASQISERMEQALPWHSRQWLGVSYAWKERKSEMILNVLLPVAVFCLVGGLFSLGSFRNVVMPAKDGSDFAGLLRLLLPAGSAFLVIWFASSQFLKVAQPVSERVLSYVRLPNYREQMGFQHRVKDDLQFVYNFLRKRHQGCHVVVYIDDLDRCSEGKIIEILQAINLILASCEFFVFVGMDTEMIYRAIGSYYQGNVPDRFPENYLRKIIQISFYLPETSGEKRLDYVNSLFSWTAKAGLAKSTVGTKEETPQTQGQSPENVPPPPTAGALRYDLSRVLQIVSIQVEDVEDTADELQALHDYIEFLDDNPREIKRLVNLHRLIKILLQKPNTSWSKERQRKLVKWLVFCDVWPHLVDDVLAEKKKRDALSEKLKKNTINEQEKNAILEEIKKSQSANCLRDLSLKLKTYAERQKKALPYLEALGRFVDLKPEDALSGRDIDDDFQRAAYLSQLVRESPEIPPHEETNVGGGGWLF